MDGRTNRAIPIYPPNFACRGYKDDKYRITVAMKVETDIITSMEGNFNKDIVAFPYSDIV
jgi:hypothetical protein